MTWSSLEQVGNGYFYAVGNIKAKLSMIVAISKWGLNGRSFSSHGEVRVFQTIAKRKAILTSYSQDKGPGNLGVPLYHPSYFYKMAMEILWRTSSLTKIRNRGHSGFQPSFRDSSLPTWSQEKVFTWRNFTFFSLPMPNIWHWNIYICHLYNSI